MSPPMNPAKPANTLLIVDDDASIRDLVRIHLRACGCTVLQAHDGVEALDILARGGIDGVILDINMPRLDGLSVLRALGRARGRAAMPRVLMLTARHAMQDVRLALSLGASDYLTKPFSEQQLLARIERLLRPPPSSPPSAGDDPASLCLDV